MPEPSHADRRMPRRMPRRELVFQMSSELHRRMAIDAIENVDAAACTPSR